MVARQNVRPKRLWGEQSELLVGLREVRKLPRITGTKAIAGLSAHSLWDLASLLGALPPLLKPEGQLGVDEEGWKKYGRRSL